MDCQNENRRRLEYLEIPTERSCEFVFEEILTKGKNMNKAKLEALEIGILRLVLIREMQSQICWWFDDGCQILASDALKTSEALKEKREMMTIKDVKLSNEDNKLNKAEGSANNKGVLRWNLRDRKLLQLSKAKQQQALTEMIGKRKRENQDENNLPKLSNFSDLELKASEIAEDLFALTGKPPSRRPNRRDKNVQNKIDLIFPGNYLETIMVDRYKVSRDSRN